MYAESCKANKRNRVTISYPPFFLPFLLPFCCALSQQGLPGKNSENVGG